MRTEGIKNDMVNTTQAAILLGLTYNGKVREVMGSMGLEPVYLNKAGKKTFAFYMRNSVMELKAKLDAERQQLPLEPVEDPNAERIERFHVMLAKVETILATVVKMQDRQSSLGDGIDGIDNKLVAIINTQAEHARLIMAMQSELNEIKAAIRGGNHG
jgi:hypothetical protein